MSLKFYNTLTRQKEEFVPLKKGKVSMYTCGPTVYDYAHIGNFRAYAFEDVLRRYLEYKGFNVRQVMNITDVDDKIIRKVKELGMSITDYTQKYTRAFFEDLETLNIETAEVYPKATDHIDEMVQIIKILQAKTIAYTGEDGSIYFSIEKFPEYGKLSHMKVEDLKAGARVKHDEYDKESVSDFALWKAYSPEDGDVFWETELGKGRPGWHIECTAMSTRHLGKQMDIHTGGVDNLFPHHENEIAQSEGAFGKKFVNYWLHCDHLLVDGTKMSKSKGNFYTLRDLVDRGYNPMALRYMYVTNDYRKKLDFTFNGIEAAGKALDKIYSFLRRVKEEGKQADNSQIPELIEQAQRKFEEAMDDDLNTSAAIAEIFTFMTGVNRIMDNSQISRENSQQVLDFMLSLDGVLGIKMEEALVEKELAREIQALIEKRKEARKNKDFDLADQIRDNLKDRGIELMDTPEGTKWKVLA
ncbi:MAG: cysteine--tRNA ligase [Vulcanimicrobiota bacterium]